MMITEGWRVDRQLALMQGAHSLPRMSCADCVDDADPERGVLVHET